MISYREQLNEIKNLSSKNEEYRFIAGAALAGAQHLAGNIWVKGISKHGSKAHKSAQSIFRAGVNDAKEGKTIHGMLTGAADAIVGPEASKLYEAGKSSTRFTRWVSSNLSRSTSDPTIKATAGIASGKGSKRVTGVLDKLPRTAEKNYRKQRIAGRSAGGAAIIAMDPVFGGLPTAVNLSKTAMAESSLGRRVIAGELKKGLVKGKRTGIMRKVQDYAVSPTLGIVRDIGYASPRIAASISKKEIYKEAGKEAIRRGVSLKSVLDEILQ